MSQQNDTIDSKHLTTSVFYGKTNSVEKSHPPEIDIDKAITVSDLYLGYESARGSSIWKDLLVYFKRVTPRARNSDRKDSAWTSYLHIFCLIFYLVSDKHRNMGHVAFDNRITTLDVLLSYCCIRSSVIFILLVSGSNIFCRYATLDFR